MGEIEPLFEPGARIDFAGKTLRGQSPASLWVATTKPQRNSNTMMFIGSVEGQTPALVRVSSSITRTIDTPRGAATGVETADVDHVWIRGRDGIFRLRSVLIGPWNSPKF